MAGPAQYEPLGKTHHRAFKSGQDNHQQGQGSQFWCRFRRTHASGCEIARYEHGAKPQQLTDTIGYSPPYPEL
jgi:hypothetical protein